MRKIYIGLEEWALKEFKAPSKLISDLQEEMWTCLLLK
jgi:hypothetical protein